MASPLRWGQPRRLGKLAYARLFFLPRGASGSVLEERGGEGQLVPRGANGRVFEEKGEGQLVPRGANGEVYRENV